MKGLSLNFSFATLLFVATTLLADDTEILIGKWTVKKVDDQGQKFTQTIEVRKDKFIFQILAADDQVVLHAEGDLKLARLGPFNFARFSHIRAGESSANLQQVDDEYGCIYTLDTETWTVASNFDKQRGQTPSLDRYGRVKATAQTGTLVIDEIEMAETPQSATWFLCFEANVEGVSRRYYVEDKGYDKSQVRIPVALELPKVRSGQKCTFKMQLDDVDADVCTDEVDNQSTGEFSVGERGSQTYKPEGNWRYTISWHLK